MISFFQNIKYTFLSFLSILVCHNLNNYFITGISCFGYYVGYACNCCSAEACINLLLQLYHYDDYVSSSVILIPIIANVLQFRKLAGDTQHTVCKKTHTGYQLNLGPVIWHISHLNNCCVNSYNADIVLYKLWRSKFSFNFKLS